MVRVAIVTNSLSGGGAERSMNLLAGNLAKFSELQILLVPINSGPKDLVNPECNVSEIQRTWKGTFWDSAKSFARFQLALWKFKPRVVIINCDLPELFTALAFWTGKSVIVEHTTRPWNGRETLGKLIRFILRVRGASWIRVSEKILPNPKFLRQGLVRNIIDPQVLNPKLRSCPTESMGGRLVFIGRLSSEKRPDLFIQIVRQTGMRAVIIGDGVLGAHLHDTSKDLTDLVFLGQRSNPWIDVSSEDLVVVTSDFEGDGLVALEAASIGIPVALRDNSDLRGIGFPERNYFQNVEDLASRIREKDFSAFILQEPESEKVLAGRNANDVTLQWMKLISTL
jgi:glycosyltransferase involved in cell wall biosynthesis